MVRLDFNRDDSKLLANLLKARKYLEKVFEINHATVLHDSSYNFVTGSHELLRQAFWGWNYVHNALEFTAAEAEVVVNVVENSYLQPNVLSRARRLLVLLTIWNWPDADRDILELAKRTTPDRKPLLTYINLDNIETD